MDARHNLRQLFADSKVMEEIQNALGSNEGKDRLKSAITDGSEANLDRLLSGDESAMTGDDMPLSQLEAIIMLTGRPPLIIQDGDWNAPENMPILPEITQRLNQSREDLIKTIPKVGRVEILGIPRFLPYIGTGWMIDEGVLITNRHVAELFATQTGNRFVFRTLASGEQYQVQVDFFREHDRSATCSAEIKEVIFLEENSSIRPDMALVRLDAEGGSLPEPIALDDANPNFDMDVAVIGYPAEDSRNDFFRMTTIFQGIYNVKRLSPGKVRGVDFDGRRVIHDCTTLGGNSGSAVINLTTGKVCGLHFSGEYLKQNRAVSVGWLKSRLAEINPRVLVTFAERAVSTERTEEALETVPAVTLGYAPDFLQADIPVPLPIVPDRSLISPVRDADDGVLRYTHFSIVMHKKRRLPFFTACNINGQLLYNFPRSRDRWRLDDRLEDYENRQIGEALYRNNSLDRGHLVRRLDPAWGETREEAKQAEQDTFFFTNCSPQHSRLNQQTWLSLEDYILGNAGTHDLKVSVFTGPVMTDTDPVYRGVQIPEEFWKVVAVRNTYTGQLSAAAYLLSQAGYLDELEFVYGQFRTYQVAISTIEHKTGLRFGELSNYDPMKQLEDAIPYRVISGDSDIVI